MADAILRLKFNDGTEVIPEKVNYSGQEVRLIGYGNTCIFQKTKDIYVTVRRESGLKQYINYYSLQTVSTLFANCGTIDKKETSPSASMNYGYDDYWMNTTRLRVLANTNEDKSEESWDIESIKAPVVANIQLTSVDVVNQNAFAVTCYYSTTSGGTTYSVNIGAGSSKTISGLTTGVTYYLFFRVNRTKYLTETKRVNQIRLNDEPLTNYGQDVYADIVINKDDDTPYYIYGKEETTTTQSGTGTLNSTIYSVIPQVATWHTMWTGEKKSASIPKSETDYSWSDFSGLQIGNNNIRISGYYRNSSGSFSNVTNEMMPYEVSNNYKLTIYGLTCTATDTIHIRYKASTVLTYVYITKIEQYY